MALACDLTRVASLQFSTATSQVTHSWIDATQTDTHHDYSHMGPTSLYSLGPDLYAYPPVAPFSSGGVTYAPQLAGIDLWYAKQVAYLATRLGQFSAGGKSLLSQSVICWGNELDMGASHNHDSTPFVLVGGGGGGLKTNQLVHFPFNLGGADPTTNAIVDRTHNDLLLTLAKVMGVDLGGSFGTARIARDRSRRSWPRQSVEHASSSGRAARLGRDGAALTWRLLPVAVIAGACAADPGDRPRGAAGTARPPTPGAAERRLPGVLSGGSTAALPVPPPRRTRRWRGVALRCVARPRTPQRASPPPPSCTSGPLTVEYSPTRGRDMRRPSSTSRSRKRSTPQAHADRRCATCHRRRHLRTSPGTSLRGLVDRHRRQSSPARRPRVAEQLASTRPSSTVYPLRPRTRPDGGSSSPGDPQRDLPVDWERPTTSTRVRRIA